MNREGFEGVYQSPSGVLDRASDSDQEPMVTRAYAQLEESPAAAGRQAELSIRFRPGDLAKEQPAAVLSVKLAHESFDFTYEMPGSEQDDIRVEVDQIREEYEEHTKIAHGLDATRGSPPGQPGDTKVSGPDAAPSLVNQVSQLLRCQELIDMAALFQDSTLRDERHGTKLTSVLEKLNDWYVEAVGAIRDELRTTKTGLRFVRGLIGSSSELLVDLGIRLAYEPSIRAAVQKDLVRVFQNSGLPVPIRLRALAYLRTEVRDREGAAARRMKDSLDDSMRQKSVW
jgi:hypothetical protein